jgi:hypothetical protein
MKLLNKDQIKNLTTKRLLAYKNSLYSVPETPNIDTTDIESMSKKILNILKL